MSTRFGNITRSQDDAIVDRLGGERGVAQLLAGETIVVPKVHQVSTEGLADGGITYAAPVDTQAFLADQRNFYREVYERRQIPRVKLPSQRPGLSWGLVMASFMTPQWLYDCAKERIGAWKYDAESLDTLIVNNDRDASKDGAYALYCRNRIAADEEHKGKNADAIRAAYIPGMTLAEYENLIIWFHWKTGKLLDPNTWTLCTGSGCRGGRVPDGRGCSGELCVGWFDPGSAYGVLRAREVVVGR